MIETDHRHSDSDMPMRDHISYEYYEASRDVFIVGMAGDDDAQGAVGISRLSALDARLRLLDELHAHGDPK